jgi:hypothetical protein
LAAPQAKKYIPIAAVWTANSEKYILMLLCKTLNFMQLFYPCSNRPKVMLQ